MGAFGCGRRIRRRGCRRGSRRRLGRGAEPTPPPPPPPRSLPTRGGAGGTQRTRGDGAGVVGRPPGVPCAVETSTCERHGGCRGGCRRGRRAARVLAGKDASLFFLSGGADGGVRMWCRDRADDDQEGAEMGAGTGAADSSVGVAGADARAAPRFEWRAERHQPIVSDAPAAPRVARERPRGEPLGAILREAAVKSLAALDGKVVTGLVDGRMAVWGHRVWDASGEAGWVLEKVHPPSGGGERGARNGGVRTQPRRRRSGRKHPSLGVDRSVFVS